MNSWINTIPFIIEEIDYDKKTGKSKYQFINWYVTTKFILKDKTLKLSYFENNQENYQQRVYLINDIVNCKYYLIDYSTFLIFCEKNNKPYNLRSVLNWLIEQNLE